MIIKNEKESDIIVIFEPWAEEISIKNGDAISVLILEDRIGHPEISIQDDFVKIWLWSGCRAKIMLGQKNVTPKSMDIPVPG